MRIVRVLQVVVGIALMLMMARAMKLLYVLLKEEGAF